MSTPRKRPRQQRSQATWAAILDAATQLFQRLGYAGTTTNRVAELAGVSIGSLYQYFPDKDALLLALAERHIFDAATQISAVFASLEREQPGLDETLSQLIDAAVALHENDPATHQLLFDQAPRSPETQQYLRRLERLLASAVAPHLQRLGCGGDTPMVRALLLVQGLDAQIHGALLAPPAGVERQQVIGELKRMWRASLAI